MEQEIKKVIKKGEGASKGINENAVPDFGSPSGSQSGEVSKGPSDMDRLETTARALNVYVSNQQGSSEGARAQMEYLIKLIVEMRA